MQKLTRSFINAVTPTKRVAFIWDSSLTGFGLKVTTAGNKTFVYQYRTTSGRSRRLKIGNYPALTPENARQIATNYAALVSQGDDPAEARSQSRTAERFKDFAARYIKEHAEIRKKPSSVREDRRILDKIILPAIGARKLIEISRKDVQALHRKLSDTPYQANRVLALLKTMFNLAELWDIRPAHTNPCHGIALYREARRQRFLSVKEVTSLGQALNDLERDKIISLQSAEIIRMLLLTGARKREIMNLKWEEVDFERLRLNLKDSKTGPKTIHLTATAAKRLDSLPRIDGNPYVFVGQKEGQPLVEIKRPWRKVLERAELQDLRIHDLRHSYAAFGASGGYSLPIIGALLGHAQPQTTARYAHLADDPIRAANEDISNQIEGALHGTD
jgi:integrase